jgi:hypothetical protein
VKFRGRLPNLALSIFRCTGHDEVRGAGLDRNAVVKAFPRTAHFKEDILQAFYDGIKHKPETTFGNVKADVLADKDSGFRRGNFCSVIRNSQSFCCSFRQPIEVFCDLVPLLVPRGQCDIAVGSHQP